MIIKNNSAENDWTLVVECSRPPQITILPSQQVDVSQWVTPDELERSNLAADLEAGLVSEVVAPEQVKIARYLPKAEGATHGEIPSGCPLCLDYKVGLTTRLHKEVTTMFRGEVRQVEYFDPDSVDANPSNSGNWDLILKVGVVYTRNALDLAESRVTTRTWYLEDGAEFSRKKITKKIYSNFYSMMEGNRRRQNVVESASLLILGLLAATETGGDYAVAELLGRAFTDALETNITQFVRVGSNSLQVAVEGDTTTDWLDNDLEPVGYPADTTLRDVIVAEILDISAPPAPWQ